MDAPQAGSSFHHRALAAAQPVWEALRHHPFLIAVADGSIPDDVFRTWLVQDYLFVEAAVPFLGVLLAKAPARLRPPLADAIVGLHRELDLFRQQAAQHRVVLAAHEMAPSCHAYGQFLLASAYGEPLEAGFTVLYAAEQAYLDAWTQVREAQRGPSPWQAFIDNWTSPGFRRYVDWLAATLDELATQTSAADRVAMERLFLLTARYEYLFWEMAQSQQRWPV